ncbi:T9SS type A sorting domain-containing protein [bacterium]|nr:T9SS type A sorting domain-containing protein [bacterium]
MQSKMLLFFTVGLFFLTISGVSQILDPVMMISDADSSQQDPQAAYNYQEDEFLVVWEDIRTGNLDIYGQFLNGDGSLKGNNFVICNAGGDQYFPHLDYDPFNNQYMVVFKDERNHIGEYFEIFGCLLSSTGKKIPVIHSEPDSSFRISFNSSGVKTNWPSVSFNHIDRRYLVVWSNQISSDVYPDIYGQLLQEDGNLLSRTGLAKAAVGVDNFPIAEISHIYEDVTDVTYNYLINEWFVVYAFMQVDTYETQIMGQRVNALGQLVQQNGTGGYGPINCSGVTDTGTSCGWPTVQANYEYKQTTLDKTAAGEKPVCESLVGWRTYKMETQTDIYGQRIAFYTDQQAVNLGWKTGPAAEGIYFAAYYSKDAVPDAGTRSGFAVANAAKDQNHFDIAYSSLDNEFMVGFGDGRNYDNWTDMDLYCQLLKINQDDILELVDLTHVAPAMSNENIPVSVNPDFFDGSHFYTGLAHGYWQNEFLLVNGHGTDSEDKSTCDIHGRRIAGLAEPPSPSDVVSKTIQNIETFDLQGNYPNPFNPSTAIVFSLSVQTQMAVHVYDLQGKMIAKLVEKSMPAGSHRVRWHGKDDRGVDAASGIYVCRMQSGAHMKSFKMMLIR